MSGGGGGGGRDGKSENFKKIELQTFNEFKQNTRDQLAYFLLGLGVGAALLFGAQKIYNQNISADNQPAAKHVVK
jgi:hypothetical protein